MDHDLQEQRDNMKRMVELLEAADVLAYHLISEQGVEVTYRIEDEKGLLMLRKAVDATEVGRKYSRGELVWGVNMALTTRHYRAGMNEEI